jgi:hypothetical protein
MKQDDLAALHQKIEDITDPLVHFRMADAILMEQGTDNLTTASVHALLAIASEIRMLRHQGLDG